MRRRVSPRFWPSDRRNSAAARRQSVDPRFKHLIFSTPRVEQVIADKRQKRSTAAFDSKVARIGRVGLEPVVLYSRIANSEYTARTTIMMLKPQDIVVLLKLLKAGTKRPSYAQLAVDLYMSPSEVHASIRRARAARLIHGPELGDRINAKALEEFLVHGIKYAFPPEKGGMTRGMPAASAA
jgi:hypothetical protein